MQIDLEFKRDIAMNNSQFNGNVASHMLMAVSIFAMLVVLSLPAQALAANSENGLAAPEVIRVYVGTYTGGDGTKKSEGIYLLELDLRSGALSQPQLAGRAINPSFLAVHPSQKFLYAVDEVGRFQGQRGGGISAFAIDPATGLLNALNQESAVGSGPCHLVVDRLGKNVLLANYGSGSIACLPIDSTGRVQPHSSFIQHTGKGSNPARQEGPHAHSINLDADGRFAVVADLGLDRVFVYSFDAAQGKLEPNQPAFSSVAPGSGPRHFAFHPMGRFGYVINEMANAVTIFKYDASRGTLSELQTISTLPSDFKGTSHTAEVQVHPSGKFLYGSNRGHDSITIFAIDADSGKLTMIGTEPTQGKNPRNFAIDPTGAFLLAENQDSATIVVFRIDAEQGTLKPTGQTVSVVKPVCIKMIPKGGAEAR
jgi:6-phosphogluconolactonase